MGISVTFLISVAKMFTAFLHMIGINCAIFIMVLLCAGTAVTAYARLYFMEVTGTYQGWLDLVVPHTSYCLGIGIIVPLLGLPLSKWLVQRMYSSLERSKMLYMGLFTNGGHGSMHDAYIAIVKQRSMIETLVYSLLSIITVFINVSVTVSHKSGMIMLIVPILNFAVLYLFRTNSKSAKKNEGSAYSIFCRECRRVSDGSPVCSNCVSNIGLATQIRATIKIGLITLFSEYICLMIFASNTGQGAVIVSYISIAWMMRSTMNSCNILGDKKTRELFLSMLSLYVKLQKRQLSYNDGGLGVVHIVKLVLKKYTWECGVGCMKTIQALTLMVGVYIFTAVKGTGKSTFLTSLLKNAMSGLMVDTVNGAINASIFSLRAWWSMVFYVNNLAGLECGDRMQTFLKFKNIAELIGLTETDASSDGCSTGQGCLWALLSLLSMLPKDRGIVLILDELLSNVELPLRRKIYEEVLPSLFPMAIIIVVDHGYKVVDGDKTSVIDFAQCVL